MMEVVNKLKVIEKVWRIKYDDGTIWFKKKESQLYKTKPLQKITRERN